MREIDEGTRRYNRDKQWARDQWGAIEAARAKHPHKQQRVTREDRCNAAFRAYSAAGGETAYAGWQRSGSRLSFPDWAAAGWAAGAAES